MRVTILIIPLNQSKNACTVRLQTIRLVNGEGFFVVLGTKKFECHNWGEVAIIQNVLMFQSIPNR